MATTISTQDIVDAKRDIEDIGKAVNEKVIVSPRYGEDFKSLPLLSNEAQSSINEWGEAIQLITQEGGVPALAVSDASGQTQQQINDYNGAKWRNKAGGYALNARVQLENGDIVRSTVDGNTTDPNVNLLGWDRLPGTSYTFNTVNVLDYIPKEQHVFIKNNQLSQQDQTVVTAGFNMAALYARTYLKATTFIVPSGEYATNDTVLIDLPDNSKIVFDGVIATSVLNKPAVVIGSYDTNRPFYNFSNVAVYHRDARTNITGDTNRTSVGVLLMNIVASTGNIKRANGFSNGVLMDGSQSNGGSSYNHVTLGYIKDNVYCLRLKMTLPNGYCNENTFYGGSMGHSSAFPFTGSEVDIKVDKGSETQKLNNNLFFRPSLESNNASTKAAILEGNNNQIYMPRMENSQNYGGFTIEFGETSNSCSVLGGGFGFKNENIVNNGSNNKYQNSATFSWSGDPAIGRGAFEVKNTASSTGKALCVLNTSNVETFAVLGNGELTSLSHGYFLNGIRWRTSNGTGTDRGVFLGAADPNGVTVASPGSLFVNTSTSKVFTKKSGAGNTGWVELIELRSGSSAARPLGLSVGYPYFDTTLNKPIWFNGTAWVDASGSTV